MGVGYVSKILPHSEIVSLVIKLVKVIFSEYIYTLLHWDQIYFELETIKKWYNKKKKDSTWNK